MNCNSTTLSAVSSFSEEMRILADNSSKLNSVLALNNSLRSGPSTLPTATSLNHIPNGPSVTGQPVTKLNPFATLAAPAKSMLRANPLATVISGHSSYDVFQNAPDGDTLTGSISPAPAHHVSSFGTVATSNAPQQSTASIESEALFQDFALSAFSEFKRDLSNTIGQQRRGPSAAAASKVEFGGKGASIVGTASASSTVGSHGFNGARVIVGASGTQFHEQV